MHPRYDRKNVRCRNKCRNKCRIKQNGASGAFRRNGESRDNGGTTRGAAFKVRQNSAAVFGQFTKKEHDPARWGEKRWALGCDKT